ncbi:hypothetical protein C8R45DRAFT_942542 [Mycena sanguinolenta]|nr:hypothetical protein C8R45DRAFT_942542 [Mycena sanguinolenta]
MASSTHKKPPWMASELELLDSLSGRDVMESRITFIRTNRGLFSDRNWIDIAELQLFLHQHSLWNSAPDATLQTTATLIKAEPSSDFLASLPPDQAKLEPDARNISPADPIRTQEIEENGRKVIEILSDSETDDNAVDSDVEVILPPMTASDPDDELESELNFCPNFDLNLTPTPVLVIDDDLSDNINWNFGVRRRVVGAQKAYGQELGGSGSRTCSEAIANDAFEGAPHFEQTSVVD